MTLDFQTFDSLTVPADSSAAAEIAAALPHSAVLKAFNTNFAATLAAGTTGEAPATVLIAGDNTQAKALLADVVTAAGLRAGPQVMHVHGGAYAELGAPAGFDVFRTPEPAPGIRTVFWQLPARVRSKQSSRSRSVPGLRRATRTSNRLIERKVLHGVPIALEDRTGLSARP